MKGIHKFLHYAILAAVLTVPIKASAQKHNQYGFVIDSHRDRMRDRNLLVQIIAYHTIGDDCSESVYNNNLMDRVLLPDSLCGEFLVTDIIAKKDNYVIHKGRAKRKTIYIIEVQHLSKDKAKVEHIRVISLKSSHVNFEKIKRNNAYNWTLHPIIHKYNCCKEVGYDDIIPVVRTPNNVKRSIVYKGVLIRFLDIYSYNYFESTNINGTRTMQNNK